MTGCSHQNTAIDVRERLAFTPQQVRDALKQLHRQFPDAESVVLSTCNRTEIYTASPDPHGGPSHQDVAAFLAGFHGIGVDEIFDELFERTGEDAVRHLFTVAASLDSMVLGEPQILSQVKQAYQIAIEGDNAGPLTHAVFQQAVKVARRVSTETSISQKRVSIPSVAVADAARVFERFDDKQVLVIGAGEMAEETLRYLKDEGAHDVTVINRSQQRAEELAARWQGRAEPWERLVDRLAEADLVISTTGATEPIVTLDRFKVVEPRRFQRPLFVIDLAVPRDFDPDIGSRLGVYLYTIDDLRRTCEQNRRERDRELPAAMWIVEQETAKFMRDLYHNTTGPVIRRLKEGWDEAKDYEKQRLFNKLPDLDERARREISVSLDRLVNKLLHPPLESLRDEAKSGIPHALVDAMKRLFQLKD